jgi:hypothetical protein
MQTFLVNGNVPEDVGRFPKSAHGLVGNPDIPDDDLRCVAIADGNRAFERVDIYYILDILRLIGVPDYIILVVAWCNVKRRVRVKLDGRKGHIFVSILG